MNDVLKTLQITTWYKAVIAISAAAFLIALATQRDTLAIIFGAVFLIGIGEWKNHPKKEFVLRPTVTGHWAKITNIPRRANWLGTLLQLVAVALIAYGAFRAFEEPFKLS